MCSAFISWKDAVFTLWRDSAFTATLSNRWSQNTCFCLFFLKPVWWTRQRELKHNFWRLGRLPWWLCWGFSALWSGSFALLVGAACSVGLRSCFLVGTCFPGVVSVLASETKGSCIVTPSHANSVHKWMTLCACASLLYRVLFFFFNSKNSSVLVEIL